MFELAEVFEKATVADAVAKAYGTTVEKATGIHLAEPMVLRQYGIRLPGSMPKAGSDVDALRAVIAKAVSLPTANPVNTLPDADRILAVPVASKLAVVVVRILRSVAVWAFPRPSAIASAKLAKSTVNHSQMAS